MYQFFIESDEIREDGIHILDPGNINHIRNVLRMKTGERIRLCCQEKKREYLCRIEEIRPEEILAAIEDIDGENRELPCRITLFQGLPKGEKMEWIIQKAVELGVYQIVPVSMKRSIVRLDEKRQKKKVDRWNLIAESAAKQSGRNYVTRVTEIYSFSGAVEKAFSMDAVLLPYEDARGIGYTRKVFSSMTGKESIGIFIGPEGGFEENEVDQIKEKGGYVVTLGQRILRTETAGMTVLSILMYLLEEDQE